MPVNVTVAVLMYTNAPQAIDVLLLLLIYVMNE